MEDEFTDTPTVKRLEAGEGINLFTFGTTVVVERPAIPRKVSGLYHAISGASSGLLLPYRTNAITIGTMRVDLENRPMYHPVMLPEHEDVFVFAYSLLVNMVAPQPGDSQTWTAAYYEYNPATQLYEVHGSTQGITNTVDAGTAGLTIQQFQFQGVDDINNTLGLVAVAFQFNTAPAMQFIKPSQVHSTLTPSDTLTYNYDPGINNFQPVTAVADAPNPNLFVNGFDIEVPTISPTALASMEDVSGEFPVMTNRFG